MKRALIIALALLALPLLGAPRIIVHSDPHFYQPINWMSIIVGWFGVSGGPNVKD